MDITGGFGVPVESYNGKRVIDFYAERWLCVGDTYFERKNLHKRSRGGGCNEHDRSVAGEEKYSELCAGCERIKRNWMRLLRSSCTI